MLFPKAVESTEGFIRQESDIRNTIFKQITVGSVVNGLERTELIELKTSIDEQRLILWFVSHVRPKSPVWFKVTGLFSWKSCFHTTRLPQRSLQGS